VDSLWETGDSGFACAKAIAGEIIDRTANSATAVLDFSLMVFSSTTLCGMPTSSESCKANIAKEAELSRKLAQSRSPKTIARWATELRIEGGVGRWNARYHEICGFLSAAKSSINTARSGDHLEQELGSDIS
jgi:hypothetical protein